MQGHSKGPGWQPVHNTSSQLACLFAARRPEHAPQIDGQANWMSTGRWSRTSRRGESCLLRFASGHFKPRKDAGARPKRRIGAGYPHWFLVVLRKPRHAERAECTGCAVFFKCCATRWARGSNFADRIAPSRIRVHTAMILQGPAAVCLACAASVRFSHYCCLAALLHALAESRQPARNTAHASFRADQVPVDRIETAVADVPQPAAEQRLCAFAAPQAKCCNAGAN